MFVFCFVGPEGSGKTTFTKFFAQLFKTHYVSEYGSWYCQNLIKSYLDDNASPQTTLQDFKNIVTGQQEWDENTKKKAKESNQKFYFSDTDIIFTQYFFAKQYPNNNFIKNQFVQNQADLYLYLNQSKIIFKKDSFINKKNVKKEKKFLQNLYKKHLPAQKLVFFSNNDRETQKKQIKETILKYLANATKAGFSSS